MVSNLMVTKLFKVGMACEENGQGPSIKEVIMRMGEGEGETVTVLR